MKKKSQNRLLISNLKKLQREIEAGEFLPEDLHLLRELQFSLAETITSFSDSLEKPTTDASSDSDAHEAHRITTDHAISDGPLTVAKIMRIVERSAPAELFFSRS